MVKKISLILFLSCLFILNVNAETGYCSDKTGVNMRDNPTTKGSKIIVEIPYNDEFYISNKEAASNQYCSGPWYYVYYHGEYGYVCSNLVGIIGELKTSYDRPWTTPKKAIEGGAKFIAKGYISRGQFTSYLKKYNVNPTAFYEEFSHEYMANLAAPYSEAATTYNSLNKNNFLDYAYNFNIPVYNEMPDSTAGIKDTKIQTTDATDDVFEEQIKEFPDSYKPALRYLHSIHSSWTFTPMPTDYTFASAVAIEQPISSIEISSGNCSSPQIVTEKNWCRAKTEVVAFYMDPRNFLTEKYIFMFESLKFNEIQTEPLIQSVFEGTFMSGLSLLDNESYSSIFIAAGKEADVSPLYLASLARQESGTTASLTTDGREFEYEGYTYSGLYNFFNIGASSGESNPAKAGLVYANGGRGVNNGGTSLTIPTEGTDYYSMLQLSKTGTYVKGYALGTTIGSIKSTVGSGATVTVKDASGAVKEDGEPIGTGYNIELSNSAGSATYTYVMYGDLTGDGVINSADLLTMRQHLLGTNILNGAYLQSAYTSGDDEINSADLLTLKQYLLGTATINQ